MAETITNNVDKTRRLNMSPELDAFLIEKKEECPSYYDQLEIARQLSEDIGDTVEASNDALESVFRGNGGFMAVAYCKEKYVGIIHGLFNGFKDYIPPMQLVYLHVSKDFRVKHYGRMLFQAAIDYCTERDLDICLHVEPDNTPALTLYKSVGFIVPYYEMRYYQHEQHRCGEPPEIQILKDRVKELELELAKYK